MWLRVCLILQLLGFLLVDGLYCGTCKHYFFVVEETQYTRLCSTKNIMTVNGQFPGPTLYVHKGDKVTIDVFNKASHNVTLHWHGVKQPRNPWSDGPEFVTQCPIKPGANFSYTIIFSDEEGTLWWHAHSDWTRATVHGAIIIYPVPGTTFPFPEPYRQVQLILGEWWKSDVLEVQEEALLTGAAPNISDAFTINGQPGDLYPCSKPGTFRLQVQQGKTYLLRIVNAAMNDILFFSVSQHQITVVGIDASYTKPLTQDYIVVGPGQTTDALLVTNQPKNHYYMAARAYSTGVFVAFDNTTTSAILQYSGNYTPSPSPSLPYLPYYNDTAAMINYIHGLRSLATKTHPTRVPLTIDTQLITTISVNTLPCLENQTCQGINGTRFAASMNNISFVNPSIDILQAYYNMIYGVFGDKFPSVPPFIFNFTGDNLPQSLWTPKLDTEVKVLTYNASVELVLQGTNLVAGEDHPMHMHGYSFYVVGIGFGNYDKNKDPSGFNLVDPPHRNTLIVPKNGWAAIRYRADNPGVWLMHCHLERHFTWGMDTVFIVKNGPGRDNQLLPPPPNMPPC